MSNDPMDTSDDLPWVNTGVVEVPKALHLVVIWSLNQPELLGFAAAALQEADGGVAASRRTMMRPRRIFCRLRAKLSAQRFELRDTAVSRRQIEFEPIDETSARIENVGRRALLHNGAAVRRCVVRDGDTLQLENTSKSASRKFLEGLRGSPLSFGDALAAVREREDLSQVELASRMGISRSHLCDIEKGRKLVSPELAAKYANLLGHSERQFVRLALQDQLAKAGLNFKVKIEAA